MPDSKLPGYALFRFDLVASSTRSVFLRALRPSFFSVELHPHKGPVTLLPPFFPLDERNAWFFFTSSLFALGKAMRS